MESLEIGIATIEYNEEGIAVSSKFESTATTQADTSLLNQLSQLPGSDKRETVANNAKMVLGSWWNKMNEVEMADREDYGIYYKTFNCQRHENQMIKSISIKFTYKKRSSKSESENLI